MGGQHRWAPAYLAAYTMYISSLANKIVVVVVVVVVVDIMVLLYMYLSMSV